MPLGSTHGVAESSISKLEMNGNAESEIRMHDGKPIFPNPSILIYFSMKNGQTSIGIDRFCRCGHFGLCLFLRKYIFRTKTCWDVGFVYFSMICFKNGCKVLSIRGMNGKSGILDPIKF